SAVSRSLAPDGGLIATFLPSDEDSQRSGWIYPECVNYQPATLERAASDANLRFEILDWRHPRQTWGLFAGPDFDSTWFKNQPLTWNAALERADRKSTRLNSSHDQISYAVFCLKKKRRE